MTSLLEKLKKPQSEATFRLPALLLRGQTAERFAALSKETGLAATRLATQLLEHLLESDPSLRKLPSDAPAASEKLQPTVLREVKHG